MTRQMHAAAGWDCHVHVFDAAAPLRPGHYTPAHRPLDMIEGIAAAQGIGHLVLVQPSVYGSDHRVLLRALQASAGRHRGIAAADPAADDDELDRLQAAGVCGVRFNLVSPAGHRGDAAADLLRLTPRLRARGWHVQWYAPADRLPELAALQARTGLCFVLDHLAGLEADGPGMAAAWSAAGDLAAAGAWIKLSGWYRLGAEAPYERLLPVIRRAAALFGRHIVWGSDWPHTSFPAGRMPAYESTLSPLRAALGEAALPALLCDHAPSLYTHPQETR